MVLTRTEHIAYPAIAAHLQTSEGSGILEHTVALQFGRHFVDQAGGGEGVTADDTVKRRLFMEQAALAPLL